MYIGRTSNGIYSYFSQQDSNQASCCETKPSAVSLQTFAQLAALTTESFTHEGTFETALALAKLAKGQADAGLIDESRELICQVVSLLQDIKDDKQRLTIQENLIRALIAAKIFKTALNIAQQMSDPIIKARALIDIGKGLLNEALLKEAHSTFILAAKAIEQGNDPIYRARTWILLSKGLRAAKMWPSALATLERATEDLVTNSPGCKFYPLIAIATDLCFLGELDQADQIIGKALTEIRHVGDPFFKSRGLALVARVQIKMDQITLANALLLESLQEVGPIRDGYYKACAYLFVGKIFTCGKMLEGAEAALETAHNIANRSTQDPRRWKLAYEEIRLRVLIANNQAFHGRIHQAYDILEKMQQMALQIEDPFFRIYALIKIAKAFDSMGFKEQALDALKIADTAAFKIIDSDLQSYALSSLALGFANLGQMEESFAAISRCPDESTKLDTLIQLIAKFRAMQA